MDIHQGMSYLQQEAKVIAMIMCQFNERMDIKKMQHEVQFIITYSLKQGIWKFRGETWKSAHLKRVAIRDRKKESTQITHISS